MLILAVESSAVTASVALFRDHTLVGSFMVNAGLTHSQTLLPMAKSLLQTATIEPEQIDLLAVTNGPGSFTGVRIGVSLIKGMALAGDKPCVPVSTLECIGHAFSYFDGIVCAAMDARCSQVYNALFRTRGGKMERLTPDRAISLEQLGQDLKRYEGETIWLAGDGAQLCANTFESSQLRLAPTQLRYQNALQVAQIALLRYNNGDWIKGEQLIPQYLRPSQAERQRSLRKEQ